MIIYLYGPDSYRRGEKAKYIINEYKKKHSVFTVQSFDLGDVAERGAFRDSLTAQSLFDPFLFVVATNAFPSITDSEKEFVPLLKNVSGAARVVVLFAADEVPPQAFGFLAEKPATVQSFPTLSLGEFEVFVAAEAAKLGAKFTPSLIAQVARIFAPDSWRAVSEIKKIALMGEGVAEVGVDSIKKIDFFQSILALRRTGAPRMTLPVLERMLGQEDHAAIFNVLASQVLLTDKARFADYDVAIKSGKLEYELAITDWVLG